MMLIVGAGAVGTILATYLAAAGRDVALYARPQDTERFQGLTHMRVVRPDPQPPVMAPTPQQITSLDLAGVKYLLICVKYRDLDALLDAFPASIPSDCTIVSMLNGIAPLRRLRERLPGARVTPMSVMFNGQVRGPLHVRMTTRPEIVLSADDPILLALFADTGFIVRQAPGDAAVWGKLMINLVNAVCALTRSDYPGLFESRDLRRIYAAVIDEAASVLRVSGHAWKMPHLVPSRAHHWMPLHGGPLAWRYAKWRNGVRSGAYPSMVADVEAGRPTEVEQLNGEIVRLGRDCGVPTPINHKLVTLVGANRSPARMRPDELRGSLGL